LAEGSGDRRGGSGGEWPQGVVGLQIGHSSEEEAEEAEEAEVEAAEEEAMDVVDDFMVHVLSVFGRVVEC